MELDDDAGCPGKFIPVRGRTAAICYACERYGRPGDQIEPMAHMATPGGEWVCSERRSAGHVVTVDPESPLTHPHG